jgi:lipoate-protein ligase A
VAAERRHASTRLAPSERRSALSSALAIYDSFMPLKVLDITLPTLAENLALDEAQLLEAEDGVAGEVLRFWEWPDPAVVLGASGQLEKEVDRGACQRDGVPIQRRASGGGTVLLGSGCLLYSLVLSLDRDPSLRDITASYRTILGRVARALSPLAPAGLKGTSDIAVAMRKVSGNAQQRKRRHLLHHGSLLYAFDYSLIGRYLRVPEKQPAYREGRPHEAFVANISTDVDTLKGLICREWSADVPIQRLPTKRVAELVVEKYERNDWVNRN